MSSVVDCIFLDYYDTTALSISVPHRISSHFEKLPSKKKKPPRKSQQNRVSNRHPHGFLQGKPRMKRHRRAF